MAEYHAAIRRLPLRVREHELEDVSILDRDRLDLVEPVHPARGAKCCEA
jgi:hypothetical protein